MNKGMNSLLFLGTGPGSPVRGRFCSSFLLRTVDASVLIDAGEPCSLRLCEQGVSPASLDAVLITHAHSDHTAGLAMLLQSAWLAPRERALGLYLPPELVAPLQAWLEAVYLPTTLLGFPLNFIPWVVGTPVKVAPGVRVTPFGTTHLDGLRQIIDPQATERFKTFGLAVECDGKRVVFSSDLGCPEDLAGVLSTPCDILVCELSHFTPDELFTFLRDKPIQQLVLTHLNPDLAGREEQVAAQALQMLPRSISVRLARDGDEVEFSRRRPGAT